MAVLPVYENMGIGNFDPFSAGDMGYGGGYEYAMTAQPTAQTTAAGQSLTDALGILDDLKRGRYAKPIEDMNATELAELSGITGLQFVTNKGKGASTKANRSGFIPLVDNAEYRIVNERGKNAPVFSGIGRDGLLGAYNAAQRLSAEGGKKADWYVEAKDPATGKWVKVADDDPPSDIAGEILQYAAMAGLGAITGGLGFGAPLLGAAAGIGSKAIGIDDEIMQYGLPILLSMVPGIGPIAGAALGSAIGTAYNGGNLKEILMAAGISAATAGILDKTGLGSEIGKLISKVPGVNEVVNSVSRAASDAAAKVAGNAVATGATDAAARALGQEAFDGIVVEGLRSITSAAAIGGIAGAGGGALSAITDAASRAVSDTATQYGVEQNFDQQFGGGGEPAPVTPITVTGSTSRIEAAVQAMLAGAGGSISDPAFRDLTPEEFTRAQEIYEQRSPPAATVVGSDPSGVVSGIGGAATSARLKIPDFRNSVDPNDIVVETPRETPIVVPPPITSAPLKITDPLNAVDPNDIVVDAPRDTPVIVAPPLVVPPPQMPNIGEVPEARPPRGEDDGKGIGTKDWIRLALMAGSAIGGGGGGGGGTAPVDNSPLTYTPISRTPTIGAATPPPYDVYTYGQGIPGAQQKEFLFYEPFSWKQPANAQAVNVTTGLPQSQMDTQAAAARQAAYDANVSRFSTYQDRLAAQVASGTLTPAQATAEATTYAGNLGLPLAPAAPGMKDGGEVEDEMMRHLIEYKGGGGHEGPGPVKGVGSGQEDLIPAWLSDGEYVWSAQDVADLGDGSTNEGVRRLDEMRQMVRRRAGRKDVKKIAKPQKGIDTMLKAVGGVA
jgi:hypothetical protein